MRKVKAITFSCVQILLLYCKSRGHRTTNAKRWFSGLSADNDIQKQCAQGQLQFPAPTIDYGVLLQLAGDTIVARGTHDASISNPFHTKISILLVSSVGNDPIWVEDLISLGKRLEARIECGRGSRRPEIR